ncbi:sigma-70 family RNA polymerase sigma factor [Hyphomonas sp.]|uniref:sigma-70 family RNA polymerase sigma factor n=1 Tax=Hyphomonas sp. TaxID=87 RepID=UPI0025C12FED|nr:sigma-70 family RNA polymerase sigma factor [Hyphomonas sp.]
MSAIESTVRIVPKYRPVSGARASDVAVLLPRARPVVTPFSDRFPTLPREVPDTDFQEALVRELTQLRRYALSLCSNASLADDLLQDTLLNAWMARDRFQPGTNLKAWCTTILRNVFFSYKRRSWRMLPLADDAMSEMPASGTESGDELDLLALRNLIALLPVDQREALLLVGAGGMSYIEAAKVCGCATGTVKSRVSRARFRLTVLLSENQASYSTDTSLSARDAMGDLMQQVAALVAKAPGSSVHGMLSNDAEPYIPRLRTA